MAILVAGGAIGYLAFFAPPTIPATAAQAPAVRTEMTGDIAPDMANEDGAEVPPITPNGFACLDRMETTFGWADTCWSAYREPRESDPSSDYYTVHVSGTFQSTSPGGIRWFIAKVKLVGAPLGNTYDGFPTGTFDGPCEQVAVDSFIPMDAVPATICGHTTAGPGADWTWEERWTCSPCLPFNTDIRGLDLYAFVNVAPGTIPAWDVYADFGG
jgi:hypothetical protein